MWKVDERPDGTKLLQFVTAEEAAALQAEKAAARVRAPEPTANGTGAAEYTLKDACEAERAAAKAAAQLEAERRRAQELVQLAEAKKRREKQLAAIREAEEAEARAKKDAQIAAEAAWKAEQEALARQASIAAKDAEAAAAKVEPAPAEPEVEVAEAEAEAEAPPASSTPDLVADRGDLEAMKVSDLRVLAKELGIAKYSKCRKAEIIDLIVEALSESELAAN